MTNQDYLIDIVPDRRPYNAHLVLPLELLEQLIPVLKNELMFGYVNTEGKDRVIIDVFLSEAKIEELKKLIGSTGENIATERE